MLLVPARLWKDVAIQRLSTRRLRNFMMMCLSSKQCARDVEPDHYDPTDEPEFTYLRLVNTRSIIENMCPNGPFCARE